MTRKLQNKELNRLSKNEFLHVDKIPLILVLDNIRSLQNVGSIFRTCDAFRVEKLCLCGITGTPPHKELHKTALGADETVTWQYFKSSTECLTELKKQGYALLALEQTSTSIPLQGYQLSGRTVLVLGNEVDGVSEELIGLCDAQLEIPQFGTKHSLNVAVSAGIAVWELSKQLYK